MKTKNFIKSCILLLTIGLTLSSCEEEEDELFYPVFEIENQVVFWSDFQGPPIDVYLSNTYQGRVTAVGSNAPSCGSSGNLTLTLAPGSYAYSAAETDTPNRTWSGTITLSADVSCLRYLLTTN